MSDLTASGTPTARLTWVLYSRAQRWRYLAVLFLVATSNSCDYNLLSVLLEPIKQEFRVSDTMLGVLGGFCFAVFYAAFGMPLARWADRGNRPKIITLALAVWSAMTICCGLAQSFIQLAIARVGVGAGESGAIPASQSLIADYFPPAQRATAIGIFTAAGMAGYLLGFSGGGYLASLYGWRAGFLAAGFPGFALALLTHLGLDEPRSRPEFAVPTRDVESVREALRMLASKRSFVCALIGLILYFFIAYGALIFVPSFLIRCLHLSLATVSVRYGAVAAVGSVIGTLGGGWLADRLGRRDIRWLAWLPAIACTATAPLYIIGFQMNDFNAFLCVGFLAGILLTGGLPPVFAAIHAVCGSRRRATAIAIVLFSAGLVGAGFGPLATGALSDELSSKYGIDGLRYSLTLVMSLLVATGGTFYLFGRTMTADLEA